MKLNNPPNIERGQALAVLAYLHGMRTDDLAAAAGVSPTYISSVLKGRENLGDEALEKIAKLFGVSVVRMRAFPRVPQGVRMERREKKS